MKDIKGLVITGVVAVVVSLVVTLSFGGSGTNTVVEKVVKNLGSTPTLDGVDSGYVKIGGNSMYFYSQPFVATSSIICSLPNPWRATSTLDSASFVVTANRFGTTAVTVDLSTSSTAFGSSSIAFIKAKSLGTGLSSTVWAGGATTTSGPLALGVWGGLSNGETDWIIGPTDFINLRVATSAASSYSTFSAGRCNVVLQRLP